MKILFLSAEVAPFAKRGGLGDVVGALPKVLREMGHDVRIAMPAYADIEESYHTGRYQLEPLPFGLNVPMGWYHVPAGAFQTTLPNTDIPVYFIAQREILGRQSIYGYTDDPYRFAFFSRAALDLTVAALGWKPDIVHAHDWHAAPAVFWLATAGQSDERYRGIKTVFTIHNLAHQGTTAWDIVGHMGIITHGLHEEDYGRVNFMARALYHATKITTVSPTYTQEIMTPENGIGLDGLLRHRHYDLHGILNGIDYEVWNPETDPNLAANFTAETVHQRLINKRTLQQKLGLEQRDNVPLFAMVSRLDWQKGLDLMGENIHRLLNGYAGEAQFILLGSGAPQYEEMFTHLRNYHRGKMAAIFAYKPELAPLIYGGSDAFLMPSLFEPCGLGQLIAMHYGCLPVVRATGGLVDTVQHGYTGSVFYPYHTEAFWHAIQQTTYVYNTNMDHWRYMQQNGMKTDFSWQRSALAYQQVYEWALTR